MRSWSRSTQIRGADWEMANTGARLWWRVSTISMFGPLSPPPPALTTPSLPSPPTATTLEKVYLEGGGGYLTLKLLYTKLASWGFNASSQTASTCTYCPRVGYHLLLNSLSWFPISSCPKVNTWSDMTVDDQPSISREVGLISFPPS